MFRFVFSFIEIRESIIGTSREESARGMSKNKTESERKAGGKNVCDERSTKGQERMSVKKKRAKGRESEKVKEKIRERERKRESIVVHGDIHIYSHTRANTLKCIQIHTRDIYETQEHAILYIYDSIDDGAAHSHSVSRIVPQNFSFEFASRNLLFSNV